MTTTTRYCLLDSTKTTIVSRHDTLEELVIELTNSRLRCARDSSLKPGAAWVAAAQAGIGLRGWREFTKPERRAFLAAERDYCHDDCQGA